jgi:tRNA(Ile)-lysidine synthetase-like protein
VHELAERLLKTIRKQGSMRAGDRVAAAVSGGADSVALLCLLLELRGELGIVLSVAHVNHKLRGEESDGDERFVAELARRHGLELHICDAPMDAGHDSAGHDSGIEVWAREKRYDFFRELTRDGRVVKVATAHALDDQAETVLMRLLPGFIRASILKPKKLKAVNLNPINRDTAKSCGRCSAFAAQPCRSFCANGARPGEKIRRMRIRLFCATASGIGCCL